MPIYNDFHLPGNVFIVILPLLYLGLSIYLREKVFQSKPRSNFMAYLNIIGGFTVATGFICFLVFIKPNYRNIVDFIYAMTLWVGIPSVAALLICIKYAVRYSQNKGLYYSMTGVLTLFFYWLGFIL